MKIVEKFRGRLAHERQHGFVPGTDDVLRFEESQDLSQALDDALMFWVGLVQKLKKQETKLMARSGDNEIHLASFKKLECSAFMAMGDIQRYRVNYLNLDHPRSKDWSLPISAYTKATS